MYASIGKIIGNFQYDPRLNESKVINSGTEDIAALFNERHWQELGL
ncbi:hypothetical protein [Shewanella nanhaiensis]|uniref:Uncharacterized protein n=1 Tax=Shewanella nanhaiensis TaxID=2864872 RepID=A0ABS7E320_9GAMM|nr:hypothetical protein [Shewanella nanhaiensis]MBW8183556.1 hypothetical protein [Shewanella nanhaiensis]